MAEPGRLALNPETDQDLNQLSTIEILESMAGRWTGWFDEYGGVDAFHAESRGHDAEDEAEPTA
jgi:hypothetical protein